MESVIITNMCMILDKNRVLVQDRKKDDWAGITFPGGHVEKGGAFVDSVVREVKEETGLTIFSPQLCGIKDWTNDDGTRYMVLMYKTNKFSGTLSSSREGDVYWAELNELSKMNLASGMDKMLEVFLREDISEDFFYKENGEWVELLK